MCFHSNVSGLIFMNSSPLKSANTCANYVLVLNLISLPFGFVLWITLELGFAVEILETDIIALEGKVKPLVASI